MFALNTETILKYFSDLRYQASDFFIKHTGCLKINASLGNAIFSCDCSDLKKKNGNFMS